MLSPREKDVLKLVLKTMINKEIADKLGINEKTVKFHNTRIYKKLKVKSKYQMIIDYGKDKLLNMCQ
jgi:DNA-binding CsgD family transcriptional regulator